MFRDLKEELSNLKKLGLLREMSPVSQAGSQLTVDGKLILNFSSNDYLGLAGDSRLKEASIQAVKKYGCGATASRLLTGDLTLHEELESDIARMMGTEAALVFGSGFLTNLGVMTTLAGPGDTIFSDQLNHASLIDGIRLSRSGCEIYRHKDVSHLEELLKTNSIKPGKRIIVSESLFSMDGDIAPLDELASLARKHGAMLVIDEAHAIGVFGLNGGGISRLPGSQVHPDVTIGTLSKALGGYGGFAACSKGIRSLLTNKARSFIYTTGLPPACLGSAREAVRILMTEPDLGKNLLDKARRFHVLLAAGGMKVAGLESQIIHILAGGNENVVRFSETLQNRGLLVKPIRYPTVARGTERVRLSLSLAMDDSALEMAACEIARTAGEIGIA